MLRVPEKPVICNNSPLVSLWTLDQLSLLRDLYTEVLIPEEVQEEFLATGEIAREQALKNAPWIMIVKLTIPLDDSVYPFLRCQNPHDLSGGCRHRLWLCRKKT